MALKDKYSVSPIGYKEVVPWLKKKHYAHRIPSIMYSFGLFNIETDLVEGVCCYGNPPTGNLMNICGDNYIDNTIELNRLIKRDDLEKNISSYFVSRTFNFLPKPMIIISYADPIAGHQGYTYQALNFLYTGQGGHTQEYIYDDKQISSRNVKEKWFNKRNLPYDPDKTISENFNNVGGEIVKQVPKNRYVLFLGSKTDKKHMSKNLKFEVLPYPKGDNTTYDIGKEVSTQTRLFI